MSQTTPPGPRHARFEEAEPPTTAIPTVFPGEFTDDATQAIPVIPAQRTAPPARVATPQVFPQGYRQPTGRRPVESAPTAPRRRVLPAVLAGVTACLLVAGIAVGLTGATSADLTGQTSSTSGTP